MLDLNVVTIASDLPLSTSRRQDDNSLFDPDCTSGGSRISQRGVRQPLRGPTNFSRKLYENEEILAEKGGVPRAPLSFPLRLLQLPNSLNVNKPLTNIYVFINV